MFPIPGASGRRMEQPLGGRGLHACGRRGLLGSIVTDWFLDKKKACWCSSQWSTVRSITCDMTRGRESLKKLGKKRQESFNAIC